MFGCKDDHADFEQATGFILDLVGARTDLGPGPAVAKKNKTPVVLQSPRCPRPILY